ncbi:hypothetical protein HYV58_01440 [Candidatus Peregrinibacteria bacterium]|nr:hypothetical protein [Candidatus Peregrinibacteria bacterium]
MEREHLWEVIKHNNAAKEAWRAKARAGGVIKNRLLEILRQALPGATLFSKNPRPGVSEEVLENAPEGTEGASIPSEEKFIRDACAAAA